MHMGSIILITLDPTEKITERPYEAQRESSDTSPLKRNPEIVVILAAVLQGLFASDISCNSGNCIDFWSAVDFGAAAL
jgi:hypothetical protein